eukprot:6013138-Heterocapsa_arctica.AAC.1
MNLGKGLSRDSHCMNQDHHDNTWKYIQTCDDCNINMDGGTRDLLAEIIVLKHIGNPSVDTTSLGKAKTNQRHLVMSN